MSALNLPKPVNTYAGEDELRNVNAGPNGTANRNGSTANGDGESGEGQGAEEVVEEYKPPRRSDKYLPGIIYPPKEIRAIVDKTALHIFKSPTPELLEEKIRDHQKNDPKFAFLTAEDPYHQYYRYMLEKSREDAEDLAKGIVKEKAEQAKKKEEEITTTATEPRVHEFKVDLPGVTAHDLDILRLTALFHARRGRAFLSSLSVREGRNYQFDFLRPTHSLYGYYNRMVESYQKIITPPPGQIDSLIKASSDPLGKWAVLEEGRNRAEYEKYRRRKADIRQKEKDEEEEADAVIDWQDFVLVETIEFTQNDMELNLPPPSSIEEMRNRSMGEKRMASMIMEETGVALGQGQGSGAPTGAPTGPRGGLPAQQPQQEEEMEMDEEDEEEQEELRLQKIKEEKEQARAREIQRAAMESRGIKIKKDYVSKGINRTGAVNTAKCPNCGQSIPENELAEHIRIELLDPRWKEQKKALETRRQHHLTLNQGADIQASLKNLAAARTDLFGDEMDEATRKAKEEEEKRKRREREKIVWDGHTATAAKTNETFQASFNLDEQIKHMHSRMGLTEAEGQDGQEPKIGPAIPTGPRAQQMPAAAEVPPALAAGAATPGGGTAYEGATISAPPSGPTTTEYYESTGPLRAAPAGLPTRPPGAPAAAPAGIHPSRMAMMQQGGATPPSGPSAVGRSPLPAGATPPDAPAPAHVVPQPSPILGQTRPAPDGGAEQGGAKRAKVEKLAFGQYTEPEWLSLHPHPISLALQLPSMPDKPEWKLDGSIVTLPDIMVNTTFGDMRERIKRHLNVELPISRLQILYEGKVMPNAGTLAGVNIGEGDVIGLGVKKR